MLRWIVLAPFIGFGVSVADADTYKVRNNWDSGTYSLRWAIEQANSHAGADTIEFAPRMMGQVIKPLTQLPDLPEHTTLNGDIDGDGKPDVALNGAAQSSGWGLSTSSDYCTIAGLAIVGFPDGGIYMEDADYNTIRSCHLGVNLAGTKAVRNRGPDIRLSTSYHNTIGGTSLPERNIIAGGYVDPEFAMFTDAGVALNVCSENTITGNYFGLTRDGMTALAEGNVGIYIGGGESNRIGGEAPGEGNTLGGLLSGVWLVQTQLNQIAGNLFGLAADGSTPMGIATTGIEVQTGSSDNTIGGTATGARNVFAGGADQGINFYGAGVEQNKVQGNYFGLNALGTRPRPLDAGIRLTNYTGAQLIGGDTAAAGNYFAQRTKPGDWTYGILTGLGSGEHSVIRRNKFGLRPDGGKSPIAEGIRVTGVDLQILENTFDGMKQAAIMATESGAYPRIFRNTFRDCYAAVNILSDARCLLGNLGNARATDDGGNTFDLTNTRNIWNLTANRIKAEGNWFGTTSRAAINDKILDRSDDPSLGKVDFLPLGAAPATAGTPALSLSGTAATATRSGGAEIVFSLSASANVTVEVLNIAGRPVATVGRDVACAAGLQRMAWSGQTAGGTAVPSGTYLLKVTARNGEGGQASGLASLRVLR